jgi:hypothetical protein
MTDLLNDLLHDNSERSKWNRLEQEIMRLKEWDSFIHELGESEKIGVPPLPTRTLGAPPQETGAPPEEQKHRFYLNLSGKNPWGSKSAWKRLPNKGWFAVYDDPPAGYSNSSRLLVANGIEELRDGLQRLQGKGKIRDWSRVCIQTTASKDDLTDPEHERRNWTPSLAPLNYKQKLRTARLMNNFEGALKFGEGWPVVKELTRTEDPLKEKELRTLLWDDYPELAQELGAPAAKRKPRPGEALSKIRKVQKPDYLVPPMRDLEKLKALKSITYTRAASELDYSVRYIRKLVKQEKLNKSPGRRIVTDQKFEQKFNSRHSVAAKQVQSSSS